MLGSAFNELYLWWFVEPMAAFFALMLLLAGVATIGGWIAMGP